MYFVCCWNAGNATDCMFLPWSECSSDCVDRIRRRSRRCTSSTDCSGPAEEIQNCLRHDCEGELLDKRINYYEVSFLLLPTNGCIPGGAKKRPEHSQVLYAVLLTDF